MSPSSDNGLWGQRRKEGEGGRRRVKWALRDSIGG